MFLIDIEHEIESIINDLREKGRLKSDDLLGVKRFSDHKIKGIKDQNLVYMFVHKNGQVLKIGKDNTGKGSRVRQHYGFYAPSTLAKSLCSDQAFPDISADNVKDWIRENTNLITISVPINIYNSRALTNRLEAIFLDDLNPRYEKTI